jgi:hypothetical protein
VSQESKPRGALNFCQHQGGRELGSAVWSTHVNHCSAVIANKPKVPSGLDQKVSGQDGGSSIRHRRCCATGVQVRPKLLEVVTRNTATPYLRPGWGRQPARDAHEGAGEGGWKKLMPFCNGADRAPLAWLETALTSIWCWIARELDEPILRKERK